MAVRRIMLLPPKGETMREFVRRRVSFAGGGDRVDVDADAATWLADQMGTLRGAEQLLYEVFQQRLPMRGEASLRSYDHRAKRPVEHFAVHTAHLQAAVSNLERYKVPGARRTLLPLRGLFSRRDRSRP